MIMLQALLMLGVRAAEMRVYPLDERAVYTIHLARTEPTTCVFPAPIKAVVGANVSMKTEEAPGILLSHEAGTEYLHLRLLQDGARGALNVVLRGKVYALALVGGAEVDRAVVFLDTPLAGGQEPGANGDSLRGLVERARQLQRGDALTGLVSAVASARPNGVTPYRDFTATIEQVVRFEAEDTLVFRVRLETKLPRAIPYDPAGLAVRLEREIFPAAYAEGSGAIDRKSVV